MSAHQNLWIAVILQIITDSRIVLTDRTGYALRDARRDAISWLASRTAGKDRILIMAGIEPSYFWSECARGFPNFTEHGSARNAAELTRNRKRKAA